MRRSFLIMAMALATALFAGGPRTQAALVLIDQFSAGLGEFASCGFDETRDRVWVYASSSASLSSFNRTGGALGTIARPGESANDVDIAFTSTAMTLGSTPIPAGTLLFVNGETGVAEIYAVDPSTGSVLATLTTAFGVSHVVGGGYHPGRNTFFLVQNRLPTGTANDNIVAEINPTNGSVLNSFAITVVLSSFTVNFGDLEVGGNGNLFVVSSDESTVAELTPAGALVQELALPAGVVSLSGIGFDNGRGEAWVSGTTTGTVWHLGGFPIAAPQGRPQISLSEDVAGTTIVSWPAVPDATSYDVVRGDLVILRQTGGDFTASTTDCLANDLVSTSVQDPTPVGIGAARSYLVRAVGPGGGGTYDSDGTSQQGSRDLEIAASASACP